jgi:hypothetical protein
MNDENPLVVLVILLLIWFWKYVLMGLAAIAGFWVLYLLYKEAKPYLKGLWKFFQKWWRDKHRVQLMFKEYQRTKMEIEQAGMEAVAEFQIRRSKLS